MLSSEKVYFIYCRSRFDNSFEDTSYRNFFSYPITEKQESKSPSKRSSVTFSQPQESRSNPITRLKQEYLKSFDELNSGFNDGFTQSKGKATFISELDAELAGQTAEQRPSKCIIKSCMCTLTILI